MVCQFPIHGPFIRTFLARPCLSPARSHTTRGPCVTTTTTRETTVKTSPGRKRLTGSTQAAFKERKNQPFIQRDEDASTRTNKHKNVGFQRQRIFPASQRGPLRKTPEERKKGGKHDACYQSAQQPLSSSPQQQPRTTGAKHTRIQERAGGLNGRERGVANERVMSNILPDRNQHTSLPHCILKLYHYALQEVTCAARQAGKPRQDGVRRQCSVEVWSGEQGK